MPRLRGELQASEQLYSGQPYWVVKDPLSLKYFRFNREEYFILSKLRERITLNQLLTAHQKEFESDLLSPSELGSFVSSLMSRNLLVMDHPNRDELLYRTAKTRWRGRFVAQISNFMFFRFPLYDPDKLFNRIIPHLRFIWTWQFFAFYLVLMTVAAVLVTKRWDEFTSMFYADFFTLRNVPVLLVIIWIVKTLHEFGHGLTCKNYGGEVHEMGFLFLVFTPFFYCNVTDAWTFPKKHRRLLVTAGGVMTELWFAALAAVVWYYTQQPSFIHALTFNIVIVCSFSTVLFNASPLLKYDGYYLLMDLIEIPNLRQRATEYVRGLLIRYVFGGRGQQVQEEHRYRYIFPIYSVAAWVYRWFILVMILYGVYFMLEQLRLVWLGRVLVVFSAMTMLILPVYKTGSMIARSRVSMGISNVRLIILLAIIIGLVGFGLFYPYEQHVTLNFVLEPAKVHWMRAEVAGKLHWAEHVTEGVWVNADSPQAVLANLENPELMLWKRKLDAEVERVKFTINQYRMRNVSASQVEILVEQLNAWERERQRCVERISKLEVKMPFDGELLSRDSDTKVLAGRYFRPGDPLMMVADTRELLCKVWVPEKTWARIFKQAGKLGQSAQMMLYSFSKKQFTGRVVAVSERSEKNMGEYGEKMALSNKVGGEVLTERDPVTGRDKPIEAVYEVTIQIDEGGLPEASKPYMSGRVQINCGKSTLFQWSKESLLRFISPETRL